MIVKNEAGEDIEVFTAEEVTAKTAEEAERVAGEKQVEFDALQVEKEELAESLRKAQDKEQNFAQLRKKADGTEVKINEELKKQIDAINQKIDAVAQRPVEDAVQEFIKTNVGEEKEKKELFNYYFKKLGTEAKTKEEVTRAANEALTLATGGEYKPDGSGAMMSTGISQNYRQGKTDVVSEESKQIGSLFGITDADRKKYAPTKN